MRQITRTRSFIASATGVAALVAVALVPQVAPVTLAAEQAGNAGPDMRIVRTPEEVLFRVRIDNDGKRLRPAEIEGAMGWSMPLALPGQTDTSWPTPATDGERVFVGGPLHSSEFFAVRAKTGKLAWKANLNDNGPTPAVVRDGHVYFNTQSCTLYAYDARSGGRRWSRYMSGTLESIPATDGTNVVTTRPHRAEEKDDTLAPLPALTVLDRRGRVRADVTLDSEGLGAPALHDGRAYVATRNGSLVCVTIEDGTEAWRQRVNAQAAPWVDDSGVYVCARTTVEAFDPQTGRPRWSDAAITPSSRDADEARRTATGESVPARTSPPRVRRDQLHAAKTRAFWGEGARPVVAGDRIFIAEGKAIRAFDRVTGAELSWWELDVDGAFAGAPLAAGPTLVVATHGGQIRAVDRDRGEIVWAVDLDRPLGSGVIVDDGKVFAVTADGRLVCVHTGDLRADGWPMWGGTPANAHTSGTTPAVPRDQ